MVLPEGRHLIFVGLPSVVDEGSEQFNKAKPLEGFPREGLQVRLAGRAPSITPDDKRKLDRMEEIDLGIGFGVMDWRPSYTPV